MTRGGDGVVVRYCLLLRMSLSLSLRTPVLLQRLVIYHDPELRIWTGVTRLAVVSPPLSSSSCYFGGVASQKLVPRPDSRPATSSLSH